MKTLLAVLLLSVCAYGQTRVPCTKIVDTLFQPNGQVVPLATITATLSSSILSGGYTVLQTGTVIPVTNGRLTGCLAPAQYAVHYVIGTTQFDRVWLVPSGGPTTVMTIEAPTAQDAVPFLTLAQIVAGTATTGQGIVFNGTAWVAGTPVLTLSQLLASAAISGNTVVFNGTAWVPLNVVFGETPMFTSGTSFTLAHTPEGAVACFRNGLRQANPGDYTIMALTISSAYWATDGSDTLLCDYTY